MVLACGTAHAQLHKCVGADGKVEYRDSACDDVRQSAPMTGGTSSGIDAMDPREIQRAQQMMRAERVQAQGNATPTPTPASARSGRRVPTEEEIKNLETSASSITLSDKQRRFLQAEVERMKAARAEGATYSESELRQLKDSQSAQNRIDRTDREKARQEAEDIHMRSGSPGAQASVQAIREEEAHRAAKRRALAAQAAAAAQKPPDTDFQFDRITTCIYGNCSSQSGATYRQLPGTPNNWERNDGKRCNQGPSGELTCY